MNDYTDIVLGNIPQDKFRQTINKLLNQCFILKKDNDTSSDYRFIMANRDTFEGVLDLLGYDLIVRDDQGVITISNSTGTGRLRLSKIESILLLIVRLLYIEKMEELSQVDIAAEVYEHHKKRIHSVGLVNTGSLINKQYRVEEGSLAEAVKSDNRYARAYAEYLLGRVIRCDSVHELKLHNIAITKDCLKYQGHVLTKINEKIYHDPFIGRNALQIQLQRSETELANTNNEKNELLKFKANKDTIISAINGCNLDRTRTLLNVKEDLRNTQILLQRAREELENAKKDPSYLELIQKRDATHTALDTINDERKTKLQEIADKNSTIKLYTSNIETLTDEIDRLTKEFNEITSNNQTAYADANELFLKNTKTKDPKTIAENYSPRKKALENQRANARDLLIQQQSKYKDCELGTGMEVIQKYRDDLDKLERTDLITYEDKLASIQDDCEEEFRESFLAKLRENIEQAEGIFSKLNRSLKNIYYGDDSYRFKLTANKERQNLYDMITSNFNIAGENLFSSAFEKDHREEMDYLFSTLTDENLNDSSVIDELTDYRSYLDYDIEVISRDGKMQLFSKTYAEKSGGETQTPYYVAIAASFAQMYGNMETTRILMMDEAFNNMDEDRIESMMKFLKSLNFQIILAAPSSRMDVIGEHVDSIYLTVRKGQSSVVEEYFL